jgi:hypothetical protein
LILHECQYWPIQEREAINFLRHLYEKPESFIEGFRQTAGAVIMDIIYGYQMKPYSSSEKDLFVHLAEQATNELVRATTPGAYWIEIFPLLKYAPPFVSFKKKAREWRKHADAMVDIPLNDVKQRRVGAILFFSACRFLLCVSSIHTGTGYSQALLHPLSSRGIRVAALHQ